MKELLGDITDVQIVDDSPSSYIPDCLFSPDTSFDVEGDEDGDADGGVSSEFQNPMENCFSSSFLLPEEDTDTKFHHCTSPSSVLDFAGCCSTPTSTSRSYGNDKILHGFRERQRLIRENFMKSPGIIVESSPSPRRHPPTPSSTRRRNSQRRVNISPTAKQLKGEDKYLSLKTKLDGVRLF